jgi:transcriptional regulator with XRE-family HTH domain
MPLTTLAHRVTLTPIAIDRRQVRLNTRAMTREELAAFAERLRVEWRGRFRTAVAFCQAAGITRTTLRMLETGEQHPEPETVLKLAKALDKSPEWLTGERRIDADNALLKDLTEEDLKVAQMFHHAGIDVKQATLAVLSTRALPHGGDRDLTADVTAQAKDFLALPPSDRYLATRFIARLQQPVAAGAVDPFTLEWGTHVTALTIKQQDAIDAIQAIERAEQKAHHKHRSKSPRK